MGACLRVASEATPVNPERWSQIEQLFQNALDQPETEREDFVRQAAEPDEALANEVLGLLSMHAARDDLNPLPAELASPALKASPEGRKTVGSSIEIGQTLGDFELVREIGRGGMGVVFLAKQISLPREVALKVLPIHLLTRAETVERFSREGRSVARLQHPNIISIHEAGETDEAHFIAMEYLPAGDLAQELKVQREKGPSKGRLYRRKSSGRFAHCAKLIAQVAEGVHYAHGQGLVHRDIKPQNLLITKEGGLKLGDFGLVHDESLESMTEIGTLMGTAPYMSPEQAARSRQKVDKRTDIYSLGAVLYEMLTLKPVFEGKSNLEIIERIVTASATPMRKLDKKIPFDLEVICQTAMARQPRDRYQTALEFAKDLRRFLNYESIVARPPSAGSLVKRHIRRWWRPYVLALAVPVSSLATSYYLQSQEADTRRESLISEAEAVLQSDEWAESLVLRPFSAPLAVHQQLVTLSEERNELSPDQRDRLEVALDDYQDRVDALRESALETMEAGFATPKGIEAVDSMKIEEAFARLRLSEELTIRRGVDAQSEFEPLNAIRPRLTVTAADEEGTPLPATVSLRELDSSTGVPLGLTDLGPTPLGAIPIDLGLYRVIVTPTGEPPREFTRVIDRSVRAVTIECVVRADQDPRPSMVKVPGGEMTLSGEYGTTVSPHVGRTIEVKAVYVGRGTVTVGEYLEFHKAKGLPRPAFWARTASSPGDPWPRLLEGEFDALPMTGVTWAEARAYAEWRGLRLLSDVERDFIARGPSGRVFPNAATSSEEFFAGWPTVEEATDLSVVGLANAYLRYALPSLGSDPTKAPPFGVEFLLGNVFEWTESLGTHFDDTSYRPVLNTRVVAGCAWMDRKYEGTTLASRAQWGIRPSFALPRLGFRCAASLDP